MTQQNKAAAGRRSKAGDPSQAKQEQLAAFTSDNIPQLTTNQGLQIPDNHNSLKAGLRGPTLLEDFILREKITHFDHERIPERVVHARGVGGARLLRGLQVDVAVHRGRVPAPIRR